MVHSEYHEVQCIQDLQSIQTFICRLMDCLIETDLLDLDDLDLDFSAVQVSLAAGDNNLG